MSEETKEVTQADMSKAENNILSTEQMNYLFKKTPDSHISKRKGKGGADWNYVT